MFEKGEEQWDGKSRKMEKGKKKKKKERRKKESKAHEKMATRWKNKEIESLRLKFEEQNFLKIEMLVF